MRDRLRRILLPRLGRDAVAEMDQEIAAHVQLHVDELVRAGATLDAALHAAETRYRGLEDARTQLHHAARRREAELRRRNHWDALRGDVQFAWRQVRRNRAYFALAVLTLSLGIGMTTAIFTLIERVVLNPLPLRAPDRLVVIQGLDSLKEPIGAVSNDDWLDWKAGTHVFAGMALHDSPYRTTIQTGDTATRVTETDVSDDFFRTIGARFVAGRPFTPEETEAGHVLVISERLWRNTMGADPTLAHPLAPGGGRVVGVVADDGSYPADVDVWLPMKVVSYGGGATRNNINSIAVARLAAGVSATQAAADLTRISAGIRARDRGGIYDFGATVVSLQSTIIGDTTESLRLLGGGVVLVVLIVAANLAIATLGRGTQRSAEMAIRTALGAVRSRLMVQLVVEQLLLALMGCLGGIALAWMAVRVIVKTWGDQIPRAGEIHIDVRVLGFAVALALVVGLASGIVPAWRNSRVAPYLAIKQGGRSSSAGAQRGTVVLVMFEFALAVALVAGAGLLLRSFEQLVGRDLGFSRNVATAEITMGGASYRADSALRLATWDRLARSYASIPGVRRVGIANQTPLAAGYSGFIAIDDNPAKVGGAGYRLVSEDYFGALGLRVLDGRNFGVQDNGGAARTVVINQAMAKKYWPGQSPIGHRVQASSMEAGDGTHARVPEWLTVIGVVNDLRQRGYAVDPAPEMYVSLRQAPQWRTTSMTLVVSATTPAAKLLPAIRTHTREIDPHLGVDLDTMDGRLAGLLASRTLTLSLLTGFAVLALLLAALGIYAVLSYLVARRSQEIALRAALGAPQGRILSLVVGHGMRTAGVGIAAGVLAAMALSHLLTSVLVGVGTLDPVTFGGAVLILLAVAFSAALVPAWRASRLDPMQVLKGD